MRTGMSMEKIKNKKRAMKYRFLKEKLSVYLAAFVLPVLLLGTLMIAVGYGQERQRAQDRLSNSLQLAQEYMNTLYLDSDAFQIFLASGQRMAQFYNTFQSGSVDYESANALQYLYAYMVSLKSSRMDIDSVYFYLNNDNRWVMTSEKRIESGDTMADGGWIDMLLEMKGNQTSLVVRSAADSARFPEGKTFSIFRRLPNLKGGTVINYKLEKQRAQLDKMTFYEGQYLTVLDCDGQELFSNDEPEAEVKQALLSWAAAHEGDARIRLGRELFMVHAKRDLGSGFCVVTAVPYRVVNRDFLSNMRTLIFLVCVTTVTSGYLAWDRAARNYEQLYGIIDIFDRAEKNQELPARMEGGRTVYDQILNNIIRTFLDNSYLKMQLSQRRYKQIAAQLQALQYQINPHFLFNTLQAINYEILEISGGEQKNANRMVENLSDLLRYSLDAARQDAEISKEVEICKEYVEIQKLREDGNFCAEWDIDPQMEHLEIKRMLLQPLLENAISHGIKFRKGGRIRTGIYGIGDQVLFKVVDNGRGISPERLEQLKKRLNETQEEMMSGLEAEHIGLCNVNQRLVLAYGESARIHILSRENMGTIQYFKIELSRLKGR